MLGIDDIVEAVRRQQGWTAREAARHAADYLEFLKGGGLRQPTVPVDALWHAHILHTRRYRADCAALVGRFVDHEPRPAGPGRADCTCPAPEEPPRSLRSAMLAECVDPAGPPDVFAGRAGPLAGREARARPPGIAGRPDSSNRARGSGAAPLADCGAPVGPPDPSDPPAAEPARPPRADVRLLAAVEAERAQPSPHPWPPR